MPNRKTPRQQKINAKNRRRTRRILAEVERLMATARGLGNYHVELEDYGHAICITIAAKNNRYAYVALSRGRVMWKGWNAPQIAAQAVIRLNQAAESKAGLRDVR